MRVSPWLGATLALALSVPALASTAEADPAPAPPPSAGSSLRAVGLEQGEDLLAKPRRGAGAIKALGDRLGAVARQNRMSAAALEDLLTEDDSAYVSTSGRVFYAESFTPGEHPVEAAIPPAKFPLANTFTLHSRPTATRKIYLDFDGGSIVNGGEGDEWLNQGFSAGTFKGFSIDGTYGATTNAAAWTDTEKAYVQHVWAMTAEKYAAFDVDVTTQPQSPAAYNRASSGDDTYGSHVLFTDDAAAKPNAVCPADCTGIAFRGTFDELDTNGELEPAFVYTAGMHDWPGEAANTAAHEVGHNLGLRHDGLGLGDDSSPSNAAYYGGHSNWFPIMGSSANAVGQFSKGEYASASNTEDDLTVIASFGLPRIGDDEGSPGSPFALGTQPTYTQAGVINDANDIDVFAFTTACTTNITASATGIGEGQAVDLKVTIKNGGGTILATDNPVSGQDTTTYPYLPNGMNAQATASGAAAGNYLVEVDGVGKGTASTGYTEYGSLGSYQLAINGCADAGGSVPSAPQSLAPSVPDRSTTGTLTWLAPSNPGTAGGNPTTVTGYRISGIPAGTKDIPASPRSFQVTGLVPGTTYDIQVAAINSTGVGPSTSTSFTVKTWMPTVAPGMKITVSKNKATVSFVDPPNPGHAAFSTWYLTIGGQTFTTDYNQYTGTVISGFGNGTYKATLRLGGSANLGSTTPTTPARTFTVGATAPRIGAAISGKKRKPVTAGIKWALPVALGGYPITGWKAIAYKLNAKGGITRTFVSPKLGARARAYSGRLPAGRYKFRVVAYNALGASPGSAYSKVATAR